MQAKNSKNLLKFDEAWNAIPRTLQPQVRDKIKSKGSIDTDWKFNDRRTGRVTPCEYEAIAICETFAEYGIDAVTGLQLNSKN
nr:hypothetical protein [uncultured Draconibacterium sp.]